LQLQQLASNILGMNKTPSPQAIQAWIQLHRTQRQLLSTVETALKSQDLPALDWYDVLLELHKAKGDGLRQFEIGEKILLNKHNLSRLIDRLEKNLLVERHQCSEDGRGNRIKITSEGSCMVKAMWPVYSQAIQQNFAAKLTEEEAQTLSELLAKVLPAAQ
jgi:DNA-binding MarR family transcriptional regulator